MNNALLVFDGGGGVTFVCGNYAHMYDDGKQVATDILDLISGGDPDGWDGHEPAVLEAINEQGMAAYCGDDDVLDLDDVREVLENPNRITIEDDQVAVEGFNIHGHTLSEFWRAIAASRN
jgi:hypothetical protein